MNYCVSSKAMGVQDHYISEKVVTVASVVPQGTVLEPNPFLYHIKDLPEVVQSQVYSFCCKLSPIPVLYMCGSRKFCQRGPNSDKVFFGRERLQKHQKLAIISLPAKRHWNGVCQRNAIVMAFRWQAIMAHIECWLGSFVIFRTSRPPAPLWTRACFS